MSEMEQENHEPGEVHVAVDWRIPDNLPTPYVSNMFSQAGEYEIVLSFFQVKLPLLTGTSTENKATLEQLQSIRAECVSRIIVHPDLVPKIIKALQTTYDGYIATKKLAEGSKEE